MKKGFGFILALILCFSLVSSNASAWGINLKSDNSERLNSYFMSYIQLTAINYNLTISEIKQLSDFVGNTYYVIECKPTGYYIYHVNSCNFIEESYESVSPYLNRYEDLYYGGPTLYFEKIDKEYCHTITGVTLSNNDIGTMQNKSAVMNDKLVCETDTDVKSFMNNTEINVNEIDDFLESITLSSYVDSLVPSSSILSTRTNNLGERGGGVCGYIAANLLLYYWEKRIGNNAIVQSSYLQPNRDGLYGSLLTDYLYTTIGVNYFGYGAGTDGYKIRNVLNRYCSVKGISANSYASLGATYVNNDIYSGRPAILFGLMYDISDGSGYIAHAVVAYGIRTDIYSGSQSYIVHYGWAGYANVILSHLGIGTNTRLIIN